MLLQAIWNQFSGSLQTWKSPELKMSSVYLDYKIKYKL